VHEAGTIFYIGLAILIEIPTRLKHGIGAD
jgi:hypothetical protein